MQPFGRADVVEMATPVRDAPRSKSTVADTNRRAEKAQSGADRVKCKCPHHGLDEQAWSPFHRPLHGNRNAGLRIHLSNEVRWKSGPPLDGGESSFPTGEKQVEIAGKV